MMKSDRTLTVLRPSVDLLPSFAEALRRGWWYDSRYPDGAHEALLQIDEAPHAYVARFDDNKRADDVNTATRWLWDGEFCGWIDLRFQPGTPDLPPTCLGHIGYNVVPWKQRRGYATQALAQILPEARRLRLPYVEIVTTDENVASQRVILANGGAFVERFQKPQRHGSGTALRYRINLPRR